MIPADELNGSCCRSCDFRFLPVIFLSFPPLVLGFIHRPHGSFSSLHSHKTLVQAEVVPHGVLVPTKKILLEQVRNHSVSVCFSRRFTTNQCERSVADLPGGRVVSEVREFGSEPVVNLIQAALLVWRLQDGLETVRHTANTPSATSICQSVCHHSNHPSWS